MHLRCHHRWKNGKDHVYYNVVETHRGMDGKPVQRQLLYLGEINAVQEAAWRRSLAVFDTQSGESQTMSLFADVAGVAETVSPELLNTLRIRMDQMSVHRPRSFGDCYVGCWLWKQLGLDTFWGLRLGRPRRGEVPWEAVLELLAVNRLTDPGSEWRIHRQWLPRCALDELLGIDAGRLSKDRLYRCLDRLLKHRDDLFLHLRGKWTDLFNVGFDVLLYDLTSTYFEGQAEEIPMAMHGYSRDGRPDCRQVVIALIVTPDGLPLAYEVMPGNTSDKTTLKEFLKLIADRYGKARRTWMMDRGIPTEPVLEDMRNGEVNYLVGTPKGQLRKVHRALLGQPWQKVREQGQVKMAARTGEGWVLAKRRGRRKKEAAIRHRRLRRYMEGLADLRERLPARDKLLERIGALKQKAGRAARFIILTLPNKDKLVTAETFSYKLDRRKFLDAARLDGHYLLRTNLTKAKPEELWQKYMQLTAIEAVFKSLKSDLAIRPIFHQVQPRVEAHILVAFLGYCLMATLQMHLKMHAPGLTPRAVLDQLATIVMIDVHAPLADGRHMVMRRYTQPDAVQTMLLEKLKLQLPEQPPPKIYASQAAAIGFLPSRLTA